MFRKKMLLYSLALFLPVCTWVAYISYCSKEDYSSYQKQKIAKILAKKAASSSIKKPVRKEVCKDIWIHDAQSSSTEDYLHYQITSNLSKIFLKPSGNQIQVIEKLEGIRCWIDDRRSKEALVPRLIEANKGTYDYNSHHFVGEDVHLSFLPISQGKIKRLPLGKEETYLEGDAKCISLFFDTNPPRFEADSFNAKVVRK